MTQTTTPSPITYTTEIAACSSYGLESGFGRTAAHIFGGTSHWPQSPADPEMHTAGGALIMSELVVLTNVDETLDQARRRIRKELDTTVNAWIERTRPSRRRLWARWAKRYPSLAQIDSTEMWHTTNRSHDRAMVDLIRLFGTEPEAFTAWIAKSRHLVSDLTRNTIPADLGELAAAALQADCDELATFRRPFLTLYTRARRQSRKTLVPRIPSTQPLATARGLASNHNDPTKRSQSRTITYAPFGPTNPTDTIDTMVAVDRICRSYDNTRWTQLLDETLHHTPTLTPRTRRRTRATYRTLIQTAA